MAIIESIKQDHGLVDPKGRSVGGKIVIDKLEAGELDPVAHGYGWRWSTADGKAPGEIRLRVYATRNGVEYGASPRGTYYSTIEAARTAAEKAFAAQAKRYAKLFAAKVAS